MYQYDILESKIVEKTVGSFEVYRLKFTTFASNFIKTFSMAVENIEKEVRGKITFKHCIPFIVLHLLPLGMIWTGATFFDWMICIALYFGRMFFITAGYHRYFAHKSFETSRWFQFFLAFMAQTSIQKGVLWWAANHRGTSFDE